MPVASVRFVLPEPGERTSRTRRIRPASDGFKAGRRVLKSRVREIRHVHVSRIANSSRVGPAETWCATQLQVTRMIPPPQNRAGYAIRERLSSRWKAWRAPRYCAFPASPFSRGSGGWCNQKMPERHRHGFPGSIGVTSNRGSEELRITSATRWILTASTESAGQGPQLSAAGTAAVTPGQSAASAAIAQRAVAPRIRLQATGSPLRPGMR